MTEIAVPVARGSLFRRWFPAIVLAGACLVVGGAWAWPSENFERATRAVVTVATTLLSALLITIWLLVFSRLRWWQALGLIGLAVVVGISAVRQIKLTGDWVPMFIFRWDAHRSAFWARSSPLARPSTDDHPDLRTITDDDYPEYRNRKRDGVVVGPLLERDWHKVPPRLKWRRPVGGGYSSIAIVKRWAVTLEQRESHEAIVCYDTATGNECWTHSYPAYFSEWQGGSGPRATPTIFDGDVFSLGATGKLVCLEGSTGKARWTADVLENNDNIRWGMSGSPLVFENQVVVNAGTQRESAGSRALVSYNRATGKILWKTGTTKAGYSSPMLATLCGKRQILLFDGKQMAGYDTDGSGELWHYPWKTMEDINVAQPLVLDGDRVFISSGYNVGCAMLKIANSSGVWTVESLWRPNPNKRLQCKFTSPVLHNGFIYGLDNGTLVCLDANDGERKWKGDRYGHGQLLLTGDLLVILAESGELVLVEADPHEAKELGKIAALEEKTRTWNHPALAHGFAIVRNDLEMACFDLRKP